jgi:phage terminase small subunit
MKTPAKPHNLPSPPRHLEKPEAALWRDFAKNFQFDDPAAIAILSVALEAHQRARRCRQAIDRDGETVTDRFAQVRPHPLISAERDSRAAFLSAMKILNLDITK